MYQIDIKDIFKLRIAGFFRIRFTPKQNNLGRIAYMTTTIPRKSVLLLRWKDYL